MSRGRVREDDRADRRHRRVLHPAREVRRDDAVLRVDERVLAEEGGEDRDVASMIAREPRHVDAACSGRRYERIGIVRPSSAVYVSSTVT